MFLGLLSLQFVCNGEETWRPIFKISNNLSDYGGQSNSYQYWLNGNSNFNNYDDDISYYMFH